MNKLSFYGASFLVIIVFLVAPAFAGAQNRTELLALINTLIAKVAELKAQIARQSTVISTTTVGYVFTRDLTVGSVGADVTALQQFLSAKGFLVSPPGATFGGFGVKTQTALAAYQRSQSISPAAGYFGPLTRSRVNSQSSVYVFSPTGASIPSGFGGIGNASQTSRPRSGGGGGGGGGSSGGGNGGTTQPTNTSADCNDNSDNDGDGLNDYPIDPGCSSASDSSESGGPTAKITYAVQHEYADVSRTSPPADYHNISHPWVMTAEDPASRDPQLAKAYLDQLAFKSIFIWTGQKALEYVGTGEEFYSPLDDCNGGTPTYVNSEGVTLPYRCPFLNGWLAVVQPRMETFFNGLRAINAEIDVVTMDEEGGGEVTEYNQTKMNLIVADPNFNLSNNNFSSDELAHGPMSAKLLGLNTLIRNPLVCQNVHCEDYMSYFLLDWYNSYLNKGITEPILAAFPDTAVDNFSGYYYNYDNYRAPLDYQNTTCLASSYCSDLSIVGNHSVRGLFYDMRVAGSGTRNIDGTRVYAQNYFNKIREQVNWQKVVALSHPSTPVAPLFAGSGYIYGSRPIADQSLIPPQGTYAEGVFHSLLAGAPFLHFWHDSVEPTESRDLSLAMDEFDKIAGFVGSESMALDDTRLNTRLTVADPSAWGDDYILTGIQAGGRKIWRYTPWAGTVEVPTVASTLVSENPAVFRTPQIKITFPDGVVYHPTNTQSNLGYWIVQPENAADPVFSDSGVNANPVASFEVLMHHTAGYVYFHSAASTDPDGAIVNREFDFNGDGNYGDQITHSANPADVSLIMNAENPSYFTYYYGDLNVSHTVKMRITDNEGATDETQETFGLTAPCSANDLNAGLCVISVAEIGSSNLAQVYNSFTHAISSIFVKIGNWVFDFTSWLLHLLVR